MRRLAIFTSLVTAGLAACGSSNPGGAADSATGDGNGGIDASGDAVLGPDGTPVDTRYNPWKVGSVWSYKLTDPNGQIPDALNKKTTIMNEVDVGGVHAGTMAFLVHVEQLQGSKDVYETFNGDLDVRYKTIHYGQNGAMTSTDVDTPYRLKLDESTAHVTTGATFSQSFTETTTGQGAGTSNKTENWQVISDSEQVTVIAGTFTTLHVRRTGSKPQDYWYARGVGKVKETGSGSQDEELMSYTP
ncbi:MAG: hypothetical protein K8W52_19965 [Deltaproteobacteria bacterium]|nr:hypothetical protein [Deltaproteobacteria bacterium]